MNAGTQHTLSVAVFALLAAAAASADASPVRINTGVDFNLDPNGSTRTASFDGFSFDNTLNTTLYLGAPLVAGTTVIATNIASIMTFYGFTVGSKTAVDGVTLISAQFPSEPSQNNFDSLKNPSGYDLNGFTAGTAFPFYGSGAVGGLGGAWGLTTSYQVVGKTVDVNGDQVADQIDFNSGIWSVYYQSAASDPNNGKEVLRLIVDDGTEKGVKGYLDYSYAAGDAFIQNFLEDAGSGSTLYSLWLSSPTSVSFAMDFPRALLSSSEIWNSGSALIGQTLTSGDLVLNTVPEPTSLLLVTGALAGFAAARRRQAC